MLRTWEYYTQTTHDQLRNTNQLAGWINQDIRNDISDPAYRAQLERDASEGLARLDYHRATNSNFVGSDTASLAEEEYNKLHQSILA